ncbi:nucleoside hydrolase [Candidatus Enterococcus willemsii]|uniref:Pyrimidine-specific ribonucleoside hydrolase RihA n=1 Tax=Candidatus Enterococcus willemsii TaxID=1857215 RepID=A0ABQ6YXX9_9ENTE|nr:nucleoside hydrolase [Enterococcus sp. CU12B]KAF1302712.1 pyrimidine-specific ribonucleoside hydrolase RihA [Enterococcus sp. CU12B]
MKNILIDCDPGHDDALAIMVALAHSEAVNVLGITTIGGNQTLTKVTQNAKNILHFLDVTIPLAKGQEGPLVKALKTAPEAHGESGMDGPYFDGESYPVSDLTGVEFLYQMIQASTEKVTLVALGPLTNIALLLKTHPDIVPAIEAISLMGGGISHGNQTALAEFNIYVDPEAAEIVFQSGIPIIMAGLDVTEKAEITVQEINALQNGGKVSNLAYELLSFYNQSGRQFGFIDSPIHDLCAIAYLLRPDIFNGVQADIHVITDNSPARGLTYGDFRRIAEEPKQTFVLQEVNREKFVELLVDSLKKLDRQVENR